MDDGSFMAEHFAKTYIAGRRAELEAFEAYLLDAQFDAPSAPWASDPEKWLKGLCEAERITSCGGALMQWLHEGLRCGDPV